LGYQIKAISAHHFCPGGYEVADKSFPLACPAGKSHVEYCDSVVPGLLLESRSSGKSTYRLRYKVEGKTRYANLGASHLLTLADARRMAKQMKAEIALGANPKAAEDAKKAIPTLNAFFDDTYLPYAKAHKRSWKRDEQLYARLKVQFGGLRLDQIQKHAVESFHIGLRNEGLSPASCDHHPKLLRCMLNMAVDKGMLEKNPLGK